MVIIARSLRDNFYVFVVSSNIYQQTSFIVMFIVMLALKKRVYINIFIGKSKSMLFHVPHPILLVMESGNRKL